MKLRHLLANSPKVKQIDKQKLTQREVSGWVGEGVSEFGLQELGRAAVLN